MTFRNTFWFLIRSFVPRNPKGRRFLMTSFPLFRNWSLFTKGHQSMLTFSVTSRWFRTILRTTIMRLHKLKHPQLRFSKTTESYKWLTRIGIWFRSEHFILHLMFLFLFPFHLTTHNTLVIQFLGVIRKRRWSEFLKRFILTFKQKY